MSATEDSIPARRIRRASPLLREEHDLVPREVLEEMALSRRELERVSEPFHGLTGLRDRETGHLYLLDEAGPSPRPD